MIVCACFDMCLCVLFVMCCVLLSVFVMLLCLSVCLNVFVLCIVRCCIVWVLLIVGVLFVCVLSVCALFKMYGAVLYVCLNSCLISRLLTRECVLIVFACLFVLYGVRLDGLCFVMFLMRVIVCCCCLACL